MTGGFRDPHALLPLGSTTIARLVDVLGVASVVIVALFLGDSILAGSVDHAVALVGLAAVVVMAAVVPQAGMLMWLVLAPFWRLFSLEMGRGIPDLSISRVMALVLISLLVAQVAAGRRRLLRLTAVEGWGLAFLAAMTLSISASRLGWASGIQNVFDTVALPILGFFFARNLLHQHHHLNWMTIALAIIGAVLGFIAAREQLTHQSVLSPVTWRAAYGQFSVKVTSLFGAPAIMAMTLAIPLPLVFLSAARSSRPGAKLAWMGSLGLIIVGLLFTYVRAGWLAAGVGVLTVAILSRKARPLGGALLVVALLVGLGATAGSLLDTRAVEERLASTKPIVYRLEAVRVGLNVAAGSPVFGIGLDNYSEAAIATGWRPVGARGLPVVAAHNMFIYVLTSGGLLALMPLLLSLAAIALRSLRVWRKGSEDDRDWAAVSLGVLVAYVLMANTFDALGAQLANLLFFVVQGAIFGATEWIASPLDRVSV